MAYPLEALLLPAYELRAAGVVFAPLVHRFLHKHHADEHDLAEPQTHSKKSKVFVPYRRAVELVDAANEYRCDRSSSIDAESYLEGSDQIDGKNATRRTKF